ncbi:Hypothetical predicted protein [Pelobates cultripes]|uniref:Uncharacterized protein n=1 Tax=Pelobates cultripes TaxID=61616 RepID=A0AAD1RXH7_PELCU|nr:Hypothetical predicted protein [Pelobates cultripes]
MADQLHHLQQALKEQNLKIADLEDRSRRNNLRIRGIPESITNEALHNYIHTFFLDLLPEVHPDQVVLHRTHRLRRPQHLPTSAARDVITRVLFFHIKEKIVKVTRNNNLPSQYGGLKIFADLSMHTLQFRKSLAPTTNALRAHEDPY